MELNWTTLLVAAIGSGGVGAMGSSIFSGVRKLRAGVALKESTRKNDLVAQRDRAIADARQADAERDAADRNRRRVEEYSSQLVRVLIELGLQDRIPGRPELEDTITPQRLREIREGH